MMFMTETGQIIDKLHVLGPSAYRVYLYDTPQAALFDGGITCFSRIYAMAISSILAPRQPGTLFLTHAHWDHCGAAAYLKQAFPQLSIAASPQAAQILIKPNAIKLISELNWDTGETLWDRAEFDASHLNTQPFSEFEVDIEVKDGQRIILGDGLSVEVLATPGHTRDHLSYYLPEKRILMAGEATGRLDHSGFFTCEFVSDYQQYLSSLQRLAALPVEILCQGHHVTIVGRDNVKALFELSIRATLSLREDIYRLLDEEHGSVAEVVKRLKSRNFDAIPGPKQPEAAYLINTTAQVSHLAANRY